MGSTGCSTGTHVHFAVASCSTYFNCSEWSSPDPVDGKTIARGTAIPSSSYPGVAGDGTAAGAEQPGTRVAVINGCGSLYVKTDLGQPFQQQTGCGDAQATALPPS